MKAPAIGKGGKGYNPYRSHGKFAAGPHKERPKVGRKPVDPSGEVEANLRKRSISIKRQMGELKQSAQQATPQRQAELKQKFDELKAKRASLRKAADESKASRAAQAAAESADSKPARATRQKKPVEKPELPHHDSEAALTAAAKGDLRGVHAAIEQRLDAMGMRRSGNEPARGTVKVEDLNGALGVRRWDGSIAVTHDQAQKIQDFGNNGMVGHRFRDLNNKRESLFKEADATYAKYGDSIKNPGNEHIYQRHIKNIDEAQALSRSIGTAKEGAEGMHTMVHEAIHGYGPGTSGSYVRHGAKIEEITTEVSARVTMRDMFGIGIVSHEHGSYYKEISSATHAISEVTGKSHAESYRHLQDAAVKYKSRSGQVFDEHQTRALLAEDIASVVGGPKRDIYRLEIALNDAMKKHFNAQEE